MKYFLLTMILGISFSHLPAQKKVVSFLYKEKEMDVFHLHVKILNAYLNGNYNLSNISFDSAGRYMERVTHIKAHGDCQYILIYCSWQDLGLWNNWYKNVGAKRIGHNF